MDVTSANVMKGVRRVWIYQRGNQNLSIEERQTTKWPKETGQMYKQIVTPVVLI